MPVIFLDFQRKLVDCIFLTFKALEKAAVAKTKNASQAVGPVVDTSLHEDFSSTWIYAVPGSFRPGEA
jgi:hypothetical protein